MLHGVQGKAGHRPPPPESCDCQTEVLSQWAHQKDPGSNRGTHGALIQRIPCPTEITHGALTVGSPKEIHVLHKTAHLSSIYTHLSAHIQQEHGADPMYILINTLWLMWSIPHHLP